LLCPLIQTEPEPADYEDVFDSAVTSEEDLQANCPFDFVTESLQGVTGMRDLINPRACNGLWD
jgi:hypothetical protein